MKPDPAFRYQHKYDSLSWWQKMLFWLSPDQHIARWQEREMEEEIQKLRTKVNL